MKLSVLPCRRCTPGPSDSAASTAHLFASASHSFPPDRADHHWHEQSRMVSTSLFRPGPGWYRPAMRGCVPETVEWRGDCGGCVSHLSSAPFGEHHDGCIVLPSGCRERARIDDAYPLNRDAIEAGWHRIGAHTDLCGADGCRASRRRVVPFQYLGIGCYATPLSISPPCSFPSQADQYRRAMRIASPFSRSCPWTCN